MEANRDAAYWIDKLNLIKHPEGGFFVETYKCNETYKEVHLPKRYNGDRTFATTIYFLITHNDFSALHRIASDETWHFYAGDFLSIYAFKDEDYKEYKLGSNFENGETFQVTIPHGYWFGSRVNKIGSFALVGCTVAPGFDFNDFEMANKAELLRSYPQYNDLIVSLTRN
jgi:hypothetical protein